MSNTYHHRGQKRRHCGHALGSRRPMPQSCYNAANKKLTRQIERARVNNIIRQELVNE